MACCGCSIKSSALTAGILGLIQGIIGLGLNLGFGIGGLASARSEGGIYAVFLVVAFFHFLWVISSIILLAGHCTQSSCATRQWVVFTSSIIICDILCLFIFAIGALSRYDSGRARIVTSSGSSQDSGSQQQWVEFRTPREYYINSSIDFIFIIVLSILCPIKLISNTFLCIYTNRRADELKTASDNPTVTMMPIQPSVNQAVPYFPTEQSCNQGYNYSPQQQQYHQQQQQYHHQQQPDNLGLPPYSAGQQRHPHMSEGYYPTQNRDSDSAFPDKSPDQINLL